MVFEEVRMRFEASEDCGLGHLHEFLEADNSCLPAPKPETLNPKP